MEWRQGMAGDWIPWTKGLPKKPEILAIARATGINRREVACLLMEFWEWSDEQSLDGSLPGLTIKDLSELVPGTTEDFWVAVAAVGWIIVQASSISISHFDYWMGKSAKQRLEKNRRQAKWRGHVDAPASTKAPTTVQHSTEQNLMMAPLSPPAKTETPPAVAAVVASVPPVTTAAVGAVASAIAKPESGCKTEPSLEAVLEAACVPDATAQRIINEFRDETLIRVVVPFFEFVRRTQDLRNPLGGLISMLRDPGKWDIVRADGGWKAPMAQNRSPPEEPAESLDARVIRERAEMQRLRESTGHPRLFVHDEQDRTASAS